jgi:hypothetical protein
MSSQQVVFNNDVDENIKSNVDIAKDVLSLIYKKGLTFCKSVALEFQLEENDVLKLWKKTIEQNKKCMDVDEYQCAHIMGGSGPNAGHKCGRRTAEKNGLCSKHKPKDKVADDKLKCSFVFIEGKHKGENCSKSQCKETQKGFCTIHYKKFEVSQGASSDNESENQKKTDESVEEIIKKDDKKEVPSEKKVSKKKSDKKSDKKEEAPVVIEQTEEKTSATSVAFKDGSSPSKPNKKTTKK